MRSLSRDYVEAKSNRPGDVLAIAATARKPEAV